jgi:hypothetical protein
MVLWIVSIFISSIITNLRLSKQFFPFKAVSNAGVLFFVPFVVKQYAIMNRKYVYIIQNLSVFAYF